MTKLSPHKLHVHLMTQRKICGFYASPLYKQHTASHTIHTNTIITHILFVDKIYTINRGHDDDN